MNKFIVSIAALALATTAALAQSAPVKTGDSAKGKVLTDTSGMTLYTFDKDAAGKSACNGPCATNWPPLMAAADAKAAGGFTVIVLRQWRLAYRQAVNLVLSSRASVFEREPGTRTRFTLDRARRHSALINPLRRSSRRC
jgi:hypothetical protein